MANKRIAELRERHVYELACRKEPDPSEGTIQAAKKAMNAFYRLAGLDKRLVYLDNDQDWCDSRYTKELRERRDRAAQRVNSYLKEFNAALDYPGYRPRLCPLDNRGHDLLLVEYYDE